SVAAPTNARGGKLSDGIALWQLQHILKAAVRRRLSASFADDMPSFDIFNWHLHRRQSCVT
ncbi:hypothetical protein, partial [Cypionkella sp.]|uniref:hypothetical protein n=1 Tax=Cypionkella sp. TaxID=2811411 RepID=UPI002AC96135